MIDSHTFFALAAVLLATVRYGTYFYTIYQGETKPHAFSWLLWGTVTGIGTVAQFSLNAGPAAWALGFVSVSCFSLPAWHFSSGKKLQALRLVCAFGECDGYPRMELYAKPAICGYDCGYRRYADILADGPQIILQA